MSFYSWVLALHLLSAFAVAAALVLFSVLVFSGRRMTTLEQTRTLFRVAPIGIALIIGGGALVLIFGVILALDSNQFNIWDPWVIAGIVLWAITAGLGQRTGTCSRRPPSRPRATMPARRPRSWRGCAHRKERSATTRSSRCSCCSSST